MKRVNFVGQEVKVQGYKAKDRFVNLVEAAFLTG